MTEQPALY